jgi:acyl-CoA hydrolase
MGYQTEQALEAIELAHKHFRKRLEKELEKATIDEVKGLKKAIDSIDDLVIKTVEKYRS